MPSFFASLAIAMIPVILMGASAVATITMSEDNPALRYIVFFGESPIALLIALLVAIPVLGPRLRPLAGRGRDIVRSKRSSRWR